MSHLSKNNSAFPTLAARDQDVVFLARSATSSLPPKFPPFTVDAWNGKAACLAKDQATREARTRTTKRYVTLDSLFFSYSLEIEEAFHQ